MEISTGDFAAKSYFTVAYNESASSFNPHTEKFLLEIDLDYILTHC